MPDPGLFLEAIEAALQRPLPGRPAQITMSVRPRLGDRPDLPKPCPREGAVLALLYLRERELWLPFTCRTETVEMHKGQVSFPGGAREPQDVNLAATARRETREELGIPEEAVTILGPLTPLFIPVSGFCVYPYVGLARGHLAMVPDAAEVAEVLEIPLRQLLDPATRQEEVHWRNDERFEVPVYRVGTHRIWGATAMILAELLAILSPIASSGSAEAPTT